MFRITALLFSLFILQSAFADEVLLENDQFLKVAFSNLSSTPKMNSLWVNKALKQSLRSEFNYDVRGIRIRYWTAEKRTAWILEEIGKERPITIGVVVDNDCISQVYILVYRESRGGEVRQRSFTDQFRGVKLIEHNSSFTLNQHIDGITGATLSVHAVKKIAKLALFLHTHVTQPINEPQ